MAYFKPEVHLRQAALVPKDTALLFIDTQNFNCHPDGAIFLGKGYDEAHSYFRRKIEAIKSNWVALQAAGRKAGVEVMYTVIQSLTKDGRDRSLDYKISGFHVPPGCWDAQVIDCLKPGDDEIVLPKTSADVFTSTNIDYLLRCLGIKQLVLAGCVTDQCVESAVRHACDLGYLVTLVTDGCATHSQERHDSSLAAIAGFGRQRTTAEVLEELQARDDISRTSGAGKKREREKCTVGEKVVPSSSDTPVAKRQVVTLGTREELPDWVKAALKKTNEIKKANG